MKLIVCVDDRMGMSFGHRRVSRDVKVYEDILQLCDGADLYMEQSSLVLFEEFQAENIKVSDGTAVPEEDAYYFAEHMQKMEEAQIGEIILYRWNRKYPANEYFTIRLERWSLTSAVEFAGKSHEKITREIWERAYEEP